MVFQCGSLTSHPVMANNTGSTRVTMRCATTQIPQFMQALEMEQWELPIVTTQIPQLIQVCITEQWELFTIEPHPSDQCKHRVSDE